MPEQTKAKQFLMNHDDGKSAILDEYKIYNKDLTEDEIIMEYSN